MKKTLLIAVVILLGAVSVHAADTGAGEAWRVPTPELYARVRIESTGVRWLARVIGIEGDEAHCLGGNPRYSFPAGTGVMEFDLPVSVTQIGLCGQATAIGMDYKHIPVRLKAGETTIIRNDEVVRAAGKARVRIESTSVRWLAEVIGIEGSEASCLGGNPKYRFPAGTGVMEFDLPVSVTQIGLCGQATAIGMDYKHIPVRLKAGETTIIRNDEAVRAL
ncbi:MAG: hypothetical protein WCK76_08205 [Elusimicrobiota bacterium]